MALPSHFDCIVIGAGFTGLFCARRLAIARPDWKIAVLDVGVVGTGSSGRNSGFVMDLGHWQRGSGLARNRALAELSLYGTRLLRAIVREHDIQCDWHDGGRYHVAVNPRGQRALTMLVEGMQQLGRPLRSMDTDELAARLGTNYYTLGYESTEGALVDPAGLVRGVADSLPKSVYLREKCPVLAVTPGPRCVVKTHQTWISSEHVVLATNAFIHTLTGKQSRVLPLATYASVTEPIAHTPGTEKVWGLVPEEKMGSTVRLTRDRRILIRNGVNFSASLQYQRAHLKRATQNHRRTLVKRFPSLENVPFSHSWGGLVAAAGNGGSLFGSVGDRLWVAGVHNGVGMAMGAALGDLLAYRMLGQSHALMHHTNDIPQPSWVPPRALVSPFFSLYARWLQWRSGSEQ